MNIKRHIALTAFNIVNKFEYPEIEQINDYQGTGERRYRTPKGDIVPSVTTVLGGTGDKTALDNWRKRIGDEQADREIKQAVVIGSRMHDHLEAIVLGNTRPGGPEPSYPYKLASDMADMITAKGLCNVDEVWGAEKALYYDDLWAGTADLIGLYKGEPAIIDFKNSKKIKPIAWVQDYFLQMTAYCMAHNFLFGTNIRQGVILMASRQMEFKEYHLTPDMYEEYQSKWLLRVHAWMN